MLPRCMRAEAKGMNPQSNYTRGITNMKPIQRIVKAMFWINAALWCTAGSTLLMVIVLSHARFANNVEGNVGTAALILLLLLPAWTTGLWCAFRAVYAAWPQKDATESSLMSQGEE